MTDIYDLNQYRKFNGKQFFIFLQGTARLILAVVYKNIEIECVN